ncbi:MAG TPA: site-2 protease family protein [Patescibacteria group bacterium]|nr:site-2 protease family protein [Patescibacteria group bacterium]
MIQYLFSDPLVFILVVVSLLIAVTVHEFAHAYIADRLGDPTPRLMGRVTLNPLAHLDPVGTIFILLVGFGWGKPVMFDPFNLEHPRRDAAIISFAGPATNLTLALFVALAVRIAPVPVFIALPIIQLNLILALFNLIPVHPLDGFKIVGGLLSEEQAEDWYGLSRYGMIILLALLLPLTPAGSIVSLILQPPLAFLLQLLLG